jgi:hypothetical protein
VWAREAERTSSGRVGRRRGLSAPVLGRSDVQKTSIEQIRGSCGGGSGETGRGTFKVSEREFLSVKKIPIRLGRLAIDSLPRLSKVLKPGTVTCRLIVQAFPLVSCLLSKTNYFVFIGTFIRA